MESTHQVLAPNGSILARVKLTRNTVRVHTRVPQADKVYSWGPAKADDFRHGAEEMAGKQHLAFGVLRYMLGGDVLRAWGEHAFIVPLCEHGAPMTDYCYGCGRGPFPPDHS
jgi:hypothetical protein